MNLIPLGVMAALLLQAAPVSQAAEPAPWRQTQLLRTLRQDCGSCHGMRLTGGLGPALTAAALRDKPVESLSATIFYGRPGTPMPPWRGLLSEADARWLAERLLAGVPPLETTP